MARNGCDRTFFEQTYCSVLQLYILVRLMFASANFFFSASVKQPALRHDNNVTKVVNAYLLILNMCA